MSAVEVCRVGDIPVPGALSVDVEGTPIAIVRTADGDLHAIHDVCSHAEVPLSEGEVEACTVECWLHGSRFDLRTGEPLSPPASEPVPVYTVDVQGSGDDAVVRVDLRSPARRDSTKSMESHA